jgi:hypothetical protein
MAKTKRSDLRERLGRYRQIELSVVGRKTGLQFQSGLSLKTKNSTFCRYTVPRLSGTATCLRTHR